MIVYTGKQYWNDFNNGDEALFQDANRPRDDDKFKLRPWLQSDKWDWRNTNKNTDFSHIFIKWYSKVEWTWTNKTLRWAVPKLQTKWTQSEISAAPALLQTFPIEFWQMECENNPFVMVKSWEITYSTWDGWTWTTTAKATTDYFEITQSWLYYIMAYGVFYFDISYYSGSSWYQYSERVWIAQPVNWVFTNSDRTQARACGQGDLVRFMQISWYPKGSQIVPIVAHSLTSWNNYVYGWLSVVRLW